jgi:antitoxin (DNA-binding transcriptional repressor) of toxin-antitoxin stability system
MLPLFLLTLAAPALGAVLNKKARFREGPTRLSNLIDWVEAGTPVTVTGEQGGWYRIVLPDARQGFVWGEHLDQIEAGVPRLEAASGSGSDGAGEQGGGRPAAAVEGVRPVVTLQDDVQALRAQLENYSREGGLAAKADLDRLLERVDRLAKEQEALRESLDDSVFTGMHTPVDEQRPESGQQLRVRRAGRSSILLQNQ